MKLRYFYTCIDQTPIASKYNLEIGYAILFNTFFLEIKNGEFLPLIIDLFAFYYICLQVS